MDHPKKLLNRAFTLLMAIIILTWFAAPAFGAEQGSKNDLPSNATTLVLASVCQGRWTGVILHLLSQLPLSR